MNWLLTHPRWVWGFIGLVAAVSLFCAVIEPSSAMKVEPTPCYSIQGVLAPNKEPYALVFDGCTATFSYVRIPKWSPPL